MEAQLNYVAASCGGDLDVVAHADGTREWPAHDVRQLVVQDARLEAQAEGWTLIKNGVALLRHDTRVASFGVERAWQAQYEAELKNLVKAQVAERFPEASVLVFDHTLRRDDGSGALAKETQKRVASRVAHCDYTLASGFRRLRQVVGSADDGAEDDLVQRWKRHCQDHPEDADLSRSFLIVNVWRTVNTRSKEVAPLGFLRVPHDPTRLADLQRAIVPVNVKYPDRVGALSGLQYQPWHQWVYFSHMQPPEAVIFKTFDPSSSPPFVPHSAFDPASSAPGPSPTCAAQQPASSPASLVRDSIESRCLVLGPP